MGRKLIDLTGQRFGRLTVVSRSENAKNGNSRWACKCSCGNNITTERSSLIQGKTRSCGCYQSDRTKEAHFKHGLRHHKLYHVWAGLKDRCSNSKNKAYNHYGNRGITVCEEWREDYSKFYIWAIENGYAEDLTIDRIDNNKGYTPDNCQWVDMKTQANNKRSNCIITYNNETKTLTQWAEQLDMKFDTLKCRLYKYGWSVERAFTTPVRKRTSKDTS